MMVVSSHDINLSSQDISETCPYLTEVRLSNAEANLLVPVPAFSHSKWNTEGGILVFAENHIVFYSLDKKKKKKDTAPKPSKTELLRINWPHSEIVTYVKYEPGHSVRELMVMAIDIPRLIQRV